MQAIILAAGMGRRLKEYTKDNTKCMVKVNDETLISRLLHMLDRQKLDQIIIVVGYKGQELIEHINNLGIKTSIIYIDNPIYDKTNNIYSLSLAKEYLEKDDTLLFESDLIFEESIVEQLINDTRTSLAVVDRFESWMDGTCMLLDEEDNISDFISGKNINYLDTGSYYKTVNIYKFSSHFSKNTYVPFLEAYGKAMGQNEYYESVIKLIAMLGTNELKAMKLEGQAWYEIDDIQDLDIAETLFSANSYEKYKKITERYGGYWRFPKLLDFCYLVNPYFPPRRMLQEISANLDSLITNYPSGMRVNSLLASRCFGVKQEHIVIGNGAAEIIKALMENDDLGVCGMIRPTFEEYPNRYMNSNKLVFYTPGNDNFSYTANELIEFYNINKIDSLVIINPDNPSGNFISYDGLLQLIEWAKDNKINLIIDESFVDFVDAEFSSSLISEDIINQYENLYIVKSISKSYGVPGLRLGVMVSSNIRMISLLKKDVSIWNINSLAEFYMQIYAKYEKEYCIALKRHSQSREQLINGLKKVPYLRVLPTQANYVCCEILDGISSTDLCSLLLEKGILIKNLTEKMANGKEYIRLAVRTHEDNEALLTNLGLILDDMKVV